VRCCLDPQAPALLDGVIEPFRQAILPSQPTQASVSTSRRRWHYSGRFSMICLVYGVAKAVRYRRFLWTIGCACCARHRAGHKRSLPAVWMLSRQAVNALETGKCVPSLPLAFRIARRFQCRIQDVPLPEQACAYPLLPPLPPRELVR